MIGKIDLPSTIISGHDSTVQLVQIIPQLNINKLFLIVSGTLSERNHIPLLLSEKKIPYCVFIPPKGEPTFENVRRAIKKLKEHHCDGIAAIGGGSIIDLAKAISVFSVNEEETLETIHTRDLVERLPLIAVPTTAGSGSEATKVMVITENSRKRNPGHPSFLPDAAILDTRWTKGLPPDITAFTGLDAFTHAVEAYVSTAANEVTDFYALHAIRLIGRSLPHAYDRTDDEKIYADLLLGSTFAGIAFSNSSTNLAHAAGRALGAKFQIPHGLSVALLHPLVIEFGLDSCRERYAEIAIALGFPKEGSTSELAELTLRFVEGLNARFRIYDHGATYIGNPESFALSIPEVADHALSGNGIASNRRIPDKEDIELIFHKLTDKLRNLHKKQYI